MLSVPSRAISRRHQGCACGLECRVVGDGEAPVRAQAFGPAFAQVPLSNTRRLRISCRLGLCATSQPFLSQSFKLIFSADHKNLLPINNRHYKMVSFSQPLSPLKPSKSPGPSPEAYRRVFASRNAQPARVTATGQGAMWAEFR